MNNHNIFGQEGLISKSGVVRVSVHDFYRVWSVFMLFQDLPIGMMTTTTRNHVSASSSQSSSSSFVAANTPPPPPPYRDTIWSRWHLCALRHCNALAHSFMITGYQRMTDIEQQQQREGEEGGDGGEGEEMEELHGLPPAVDLLLIGLSESKRRNGHGNGHGGHGNGNGGSNSGSGSSSAAEFASVNGILLVDSSVIDVDHAGSARSATRIDLVDHLKQENVIHKNDPIVLEYVNFFLYIYTCYYYFIPLLLISASIAQYNSFTTLIFFLSFFFIYICTNFIENNLNIFYSL